MSPQKSDGLPYEVHLQVGGEYFVSTNIDVSDGLFNGATGTLKAIEYGHTREGLPVPKRVWLDFHNPQIGVARRKSKQMYQKRKGYNAEWVPIDRITKRLSLVGKSRAVEVVRTQLPLIAANAMTINKSQGSTLKSVVVSVRKRLSRERLYVGCSRATTKTGLFIDGKFEPPEIPKDDDEVTAEMLILRESPVEMTVQFLQDFDDSFIKLYYHNIESYLRHFKDLYSDNCVKNSDIIALIEPQLLRDDTLDTNVFEIIHRTNCNQNRNSEGALILRKNNVPVNDTEVKLFKLLNGHCYFVHWNLNDVCFIMTYKSPKFPKTEYVTHARSILHGKDKIILFGDININIADTQGIGSSFLKAMTDFGMKTVIKEGDITTLGGTCIDICFTNIKGIIGWVYESIYSYHKPICIAVPKLLL